MSPSTPAEGVVQLHPGGCHVAALGERISTLLGSCIAACVRDTRLGLGGMNHFMLPEPDLTKNRSAPWLDAPFRYGSYAMEQLVSELLRRGASRAFLEVKVFGGGRMLQGMSDVGAQNAAFVREYLALESLPLLAEDVGGDRPRRIVFDPATGEVLVRRLGSLQPNALASREASFRRQPLETGSVELWGAP